MHPDKELYRNIIEELVPFNKFLNFEMVEISTGFCKFRVPFKEELIGNPVARALHGGVISAAMDAVGGAAGLTTLVSFDDKISTIDIRVDYLLPGRAEDLFVEGKIVRSGNRILVTQIRAYHNNPDELIAEGKAVYNVKRNIDKT